ncbi:lectin [Rhizobium anhuiense]|uniref:BA14K family protein n=1 Tax=Rhizobium anhuiense TaxID=1184720 RepID=UPI000BE839FD|nr:BA14K family protein [Rhizobium anhuiense]PDS54977.1 lectin [Rhizobium anhuiense]
MKKLAKPFAIAILIAAMGAGSSSAGNVPLPIRNDTQVGLLNEVQYRRPPPRRGWYNGQRGYRSYHRGYRRHNDGYWYPLAAFGAGAFIGGALAGPRTYAGSSRHVQWCSDRYQTYRASDNSYVPRVGVRAQCNSPYN